MILLLILLVLVVMPAAASANGFTVTLTPQSEPVVGQPMILQAGGTIPVEYAWFGYYFSAVVIPTTVVSECPTDHWAGYQVGRGTGAVLTIAQREQPDGSGRFAFPVAFRPWVPGRFLVCSYTDDGATQTMAASTLVLDVPASAPAVVKRPGVRRSGRRLVCGRGTWSGEPTAFAYRWIVGGRARGGGRTLAVRRLRGRRVRCSVTASNAAGSATAVSRTVRI
jgi:hypothetical protein